MEGSPFRRPKPLLLLAYLSLEGSKARRYLAELFFMDATDPLNSLSRALSYLRNDAPGTIDADEQKVWATLPCDAAAFINHADQKRLEEALALYRGPFLESLALPLGGELEEWVYGTREYLAGRFRNVLLQLAEEAGKGNLLQAARYAETAYTLTGAPELEPEHFSRLHILLARTDNPHAAELRKQAEEYGITLTPLRSEERARLEAPPEPTTTANNLPLSKSSFVGRDQELAAIVTQLSKPDCRLLSIHGTGGVGKSRLALQAAYDQLRQGGWEGIHFVALDALNSAELIASSIADAVGLELQGQDDTLTQVSRFIAQKRLLLVLDNYEHLIEGATLTSKLLAVCPNLKLLVTSRERLNVEEEWVLTLGGLSVPEATPETLNEAQGFEAVDLFLQRAKRAKLDFRMSEEDLPHVLRICRLVDGLPLGLELAAVWVKTLPLAEIASEVEHNLSILSTPARNVAERHQSIRAVFEHSWKLLSEKEQEVLRKLSVFVGGFRREAAAEVAGATLPVLTGLVDKSLVRVSETGRYDRHVLLYEYFREKLAAAPNEAAEVSQKHALYYSKLAQRSIGKQRREYQNDSMRLVEQELRNIEVAFRWLVNTDQFGETQANSDLYLLFTRRARFQEGIDFYAYIAAHLDPVIHGTAKALATIHQASFHYYKGEYSQASDLAEQGLALLSRTENPRYLGFAQTTLALIAAAQGEFLIAKDYYENALDNIRLASDIQGVATLHFNLSELERTLGNYEAAFNHGAEALSAFREGGNVYGEASALLSLGEVKLELHQPEEALSTLMSALEIATGINHYALLGYLYNSLARAQLNLGALDEAYEYGKTGLRLVKETGERLSEGSIYRTMGEIALERNQLEHAVDNFRRSLAIAQEQQNIPECQASFLSFAKAFLKLGKQPEAQQLLRAVLSSPAAQFQDKRDAEMLLQTHSGEPEASSSGTMGLEAMIEDVVLSLSKRLAKG